MSDPTFASYMKDIDNLLTAKSGLGVDDLADYAYRDAFTDEVDPEEVADEVLAENNFPQ